MNELDRFFQIFVESLDEIPQSYFYTLYQNFEGLNAFLANRGKFNGEDFERYNERVFCYELYHQLRKKLDIEGPNFLNNTTLQGEVKKVQVKQFVERLGLEGLSKEFIPDFLMHSSGSTDNHYFVLEVKCHPDVSSDEILSDLRKINEFITNYRYERGIFLSINAHRENLANRLGKILDEAKELVFPKISVVCKQDHDAPTLIWDWNANEWRG